MNNWKDKIATMILVKQELMKQDVEKYGHTIFQRWEQMKNLFALLNKNWDINLIQCIEIFSICQWLGRFLSNGGFIWYGAIKGIFYNGLCSDAIKSYR